MPDLLNVDVERDTVAAIARAIAPVKVFREGDHFRGSSPLIFVKILTPDNEAVPSSAAGPQESIWTFEIECYVKSPREGEKFGELSKLADKVRAVCDSQRAAPDVTITDGGNPPSNIGTLRWGFASETREFGLEEVSIDRKTIKNVDLATIEVEAQVWICT